MAFEPDILVTGHESSRLLFVVEAKFARVEDDVLVSTEAKLRDYMMSVMCSLGAIITPFHFRLYRNAFTSYEPASIELLGDFDLSQETIFDRSLHTSGVAFETDVQRWIEGLRDERNRAGLSAPLRAAIEAHVLPALWEGEVRAAHHRSLVSRASERGNGA